MFPPEKHVGHGLCGCARVNGLVKAEFTEISKQNKFSCVVKTHLMSTLSHVHTGIQICLDTALSKDKLFGNVSET